MTKANTANNKKEFEKLKQFIEGLPEYFSGISAGYVEYLADKKGLLYQEEIKKLCVLLDFFYDHLFEENGLRLEAILWHIDRILLHHDLKHNKKITKATREALEPYTEFMELTERGRFELKRDVCDLVCWFYGIYGLIASIKAFKKATGIKGFDFMLKKMSMLQTPLKWKDTSFYDLKKACKDYRGYRFEDHIAVMNKGLLELKERGIDLGIPALEFKDIRPSAKTVNAIAESGHFLNNSFPLEGNYLIHVYMSHEAYFNQVKDNYFIYERLLIENENAMKANGFMDRF